MSEQGEPALSFWEAYTDSEDDSTKDTGGKSIPVVKVPGHLQQQKLSEEADGEFVKDMFSDFNIATGNVENEDDIFASNPLKQIALSDPFEQIELKCLKDCDNVTKRLCQKITESPAKSAIWLQFLDTLLQACDKKMELRDLQTLRRKVDASIKAREDQQRDRTFAKKKPNDVTTSKNYQDELDMMYGDLSYDEEDDPFYYQ
ncbi:Eukaryotic translation initiation factor 3 subunit J [Babesia duncani]|uniref:Eukaryotic translation initiation factor 3 subunit J n=1 Tax=Babesia duncani TaxID=323732 RepID=A0AAD9UQ17_9APIC|nr:Eukaryotic translation initiation factor 3 subunit J [Babesia duncani]